ncbi:MAG: precorrin-3B synthase [Rhodococcus sp.]|nr:precorrin-3B synthase [Rhodococcus sp. (in: high G+C Gram-positive bacteria)]
MSDCTPLRLHVPGGQLTATQLQVLTEVAEELGNGEIELTADGHLQLPEVVSSAELPVQIREAALAPRPQHSGHRIASSPLSGRVGGQTDVREVVQELDRAIASTNTLADLSHRFLFTIDDGSNDVSPLHADFGVHAVSGNEYALVFSGTDVGVRISTDSAVLALVESAQIFTELSALSATHERIGELADRHQSIVDRLRDRLDLTESPSSLALSSDASAPIGWFEQADGKVTLGATVADSVLPARLLQFLVAIDCPMIITPWRSLLLLDLAEGAADQIVRILAPMGLIFDANSPWAQLQPFSED